MRVSIVIPTVNAPCLRQCLEALWANTPSFLEWEVIIVCDQPDEERMVLLREYEAKGAHLVVNRERVGVPRAFNQGMEAASGDYLLLMNDDIIVQGDWLTPMVMALGQNAAFGYVAPVVERDSRDRIYYFAGFAECSLMSRECYSKVGPLDESEVFRHFLVDGDYWVRLTRAGYAPHGVAESTVQHLVGQTIAGSLTPEYMNAGMEELARRYGAAHLQDQHHLPAWSVVAGSERPQPRLYYLTADTVGETSGGGEASGNEAKALAGVGDVTIFDRKMLDRVVGKMGESPFLQDYAMLWAMQENLTREKPSLAHFYGGIFSQTVRYLKMAGVPVTYTVAAHDRRQSIAEFFALGMEYPWAHVRDEGLWTMHKTGFLNADLVIAPSNASAEFLREEGCRNVAIIPHGCDIPVEPPPLPQEFAAGYLGALGPDKGVAYLLKGWAMFRKRYGGQLFIAGRQSGDLGAVLAGACMPISLREGLVDVQCLGWVQAPSDLYARVSVYIQASVTEGFGIEVGEAMACGRPVIVSDGAGAADMVTDGIDGFVVPARDAGAIAERLAFLYQNPEKLAQMGQQARMKAFGYSWQTIRAMYQRAWREYVAV